MRHELQGVAPTQAKHGVWMAENESFNRIRHFLMPCPKDGAYISRLLERRRISLGSISPTRRKKQLYGHSLRQWSASWLSIASSSVRRAWVAGASETQMQPQGGVDLVHAPLRDATHAMAEAFNGDRADPFRLGFRVSPQTAIAGRQPDLEGIRAANVAGYRHDRNHASVHRCRALVRRVVAHDDRGPLESCLGANRVAEIHHPCIAPPCRYSGAHGVRPSRDDRSHVLSSSSSHSAHAEA